MSRGASLGRASSTPAEACIDAPGRSPGKILVVDDEPLVRKKMTHHLHKLGYHVLEAADGAEALEVAQRERPDLMILDWIMPKLDGPTLCERLKGDPAHRTMQLILMTAHDKPEQIAEGLARGADDFLSKAASLQETTARVQAGLRAHALVKELEYARDTLNRSYQLLAHHQEELETDLRSAAEFVQSLLPPSGNWAPGVTLSWQYLPSKALGGDLFNVAVWGERDLGFCILDASGQGASAALRAATLMSLLRTSSVVRHVCSYDPGAIVTEMNRRFPLSPEGDYFTLWVGALNLPSRVLRFSTAGHAGAVLFRSGGTMVPLARATFPLGFQPETQYTSQTLTLETGDRLFLFSDGLYETRSPTAELWGRERLESVLAGSGNTPLAEALSRTVRAARDWHQQEHFLDDAALLGLEMIDQSPPVA